jgi:hypothetical protein
MSLYLHIKLYRIGPRLFDQGLNKSCTSLVICCLAILHARNVKFILNERNQQLYIVDKFQTYSS